MMFSNSKKSEINVTAKNKGECGMSISIENLQKAFVAMPASQRAYYSMVYSAISDGSTEADVQDICGAELEKANLDVLIALAKEMLAKERGEKVEIKEMLLKNRSTASAVLPILVECELICSQEELKSQVVDDLFELSNEGFEEYCQQQQIKSQKLHKIWERVKSVMFYVSSGEISTEEVRALREISQKDIVPAVMMAIELGSKPYWNELQEKYGADDVEYVKCLIQG